jgi:threonine/homoserine/homoserine lactone efflux protein
MDLLTFALISIGFIAIPGPNVLVIISTSLSHGFRRGLQAAVGISLAMLIQLSVAAMGTTWFVTTLTQGLVWLKWIGVLYLFYLGTNQIIQAVSAKSSQKQVTGFDSF